jgi:putative transposase
MARQLRIEYPGAFYHVFSRGNQKQPIFLSDDDRYFFLNCLRRACKKFGVIVHAYCLMTNHFHHFLETPQGDLSRVMHSLITSYSVYFNKKHDRVGHLFQGRYKSVLVEAASYAKELSRYIHLNPVRSGLVDAPAGYPWSSYDVYLGTVKPEKWLDTTVVLKLFGERMAESRRSYARYVGEGVGKEQLELIRASARTGILGSDAFIARIRKEHLQEELANPSRDTPQIRRLRKRPDLPAILSASERVLGARNKYLVPVVIFLGHKNSPLGLREIGEFFSLSVSSVSNARLRAKTAIAGNSVLAEAVAEIEKAIDEGVDEDGEERVRSTFFEKK